MKNAVFLLIAFSLAFISCDDEDDPIIDPTSATELKETLITGVWKITEYLEDDVNQTSDFEGYTFVFNEDGTIVAAKTSETYNGTWFIDPDDSPEDIDLNMSFGSVSPIDELNEDWDIVSVSTNIIELKNESSGNGGTDFLTFKK